MSISQVRKVGKTDTIEQILNKNKNIYIYIHTHNCIFIYKFLSQNMTHHTQLQIKLTLSRGTAREGAIGAILRSVVYQITPFEKNGMDAGLIAYWRYAEARVARTPLPQHGRKASL